MKSSASGKSRPATSVEDGERSELKAGLLCLSEVTAGGLSGPAVDNQSHSQEQLDTGTAHKLRTRSTFWTIACAQCTAAEG